MCRQWRARGRGGITVFLLQGCGSAVKRDRARSRRSVLVLRAVLNASSPHSINHSNNLSAAPAQPKSSFDFLLLFGMMGVPL